MAITLEKTGSNLHMEVQVRQRPNGLRVLRLLRELSFIDGKLTSSIRHAGDFPLVTAVLAAVVIALAVVVANLPLAQSAPAPASSLPAVVDASAEQQAASELQTRAYTAWLGQAHAQAAAQGSEASVSEAF